MKHCNCKEYRAEVDGIPPSDLELMVSRWLHCPFCGKELTLKYTITVYACTEPEPEPEYNDDGSVDNAKNYYNQRTVFEKEFNTYQERNKFLDKMSAEFSEPVRPTYTEIDHWLVMSGSITTKGAGSMGVFFAATHMASEFRLWKGKSVDEWTDSQ